MKPKEISLKDANTILGKIKDPEVAGQIKSILYHQDEKRIYCQSCKKEIGIVDLSGSKPRYIKESGIMSARQRFDGEWGFECVCGNDSRIAEQEKGIITSSIPTKEDMNKIFNNIKKKPTKVVESATGKVIDGFVIKG